MILWEWVGMIGSILVLDLALSGDNALVLGAAAAGLPQKQRWYALFFGGAGAIVLRILFSSIATVVLNIPWLQTAGAVILIVIAVRLLAERASEAEKKEEGEEGRAGGEANLKTAALTILVADVTMSLDNVLAVGAAANGDFLPIVIGLLISIAIIISGSALIATLMNHIPWLLDLAALVLACTSATMLHDDLAPVALNSHIPWLVSISQPVLPFHFSWFLLLLGSVTCIIVILFDAFYLRRTKRARRESQKVA